MLYINKITNDPQQNMTLTGIPGLQIDMTLRFMPRIRAWEAGFSFNGQIIDGVSIVTCPNILRQFRNTIPFGIMCVRADGLDPYTVTDFSTQLSNLYLLDAADVQALEADFYS